MDEVNFLLLSLYASMAPHSAQLVLISLNTNDVPSASRGSIHTSVVTLYDTSYTEGSVSYVDHKYATITLKDVSILRSLPCCCQRLSEPTV